MSKSTPPTFSYVHDLDHRFTYLSSSVNDVLGYSPADLLGRRYDVLLREGALNEAVHANTDAAMAVGLAGPTYTAEVVHRDGRTVLLEIEEAPHRRHGEVVGMKGVARDVTATLRAPGTRRRS